MQGVGCWPWPSSWRRGRPLVSTGHTAAPGCAKGPLCPGSPLSTGPVRAGALCLSSPKRHSRGMGLIWLQKYLRNIFQIVLALNSCISQLWVDFLFNISLKFFQLQFSSFLSGKMDAEWPPLSLLPLDAQRAWLIELWSFPHSSGTVPHLTVPPANRVEARQKGKGGREMSAWSLGPRPTQRKGCHVAVRQRQRRGFPEPELCPYSHGSGRRSASWLLGRKAGGEGRCGVWGDGS